MWPTQWAGQHSASHVVSLGCVPQRGNTLLHAGGTLGWGAPESDQQESAGPAFEVHGPPAKRTLRQACGAMVMRQGSFCRDARDCAAEFLCWEG